DAETGRLRLLPRNGCPGPAVFDELPAVRVVALDTEWLLRSETKEQLKPLGQGVCKDPSEGGFSEPVQTQAVDDRIHGALRPADGRRVLLLGHHPLGTTGPHGGFFPLKTHLFPLTELVPWLYVPLPGLGSLYAVGRRYLTSQDLGGPRNRAMRRRLEREL